MNQFEQSLFKKGYCRLQPGSYRIWISKRWHGMFVRRGLVRKNFYGQYSPHRETLGEFCRWLELYDKLCHDKDFPKSKRQINPAEMDEIRLQII